MDKINKIKRVRTAEIKCSLIRSTGIQDFRSQAKIVTEFVQLLFQQFLPERFLLDTS